MEKQKSLQGAESNEGSRWLTLRSVPLSQSVSNDLNGAESDTGNIRRTLFLENGSYTSFDSFEFNRRGGGRGGQDGHLSYHHNVLTRCFCHCSFAPHRFWVLMSIGQSPPCSVCCGVPRPPTLAQTVGSFGLVLYG